MPRFFLHLWNGKEFVTDQEGDELASAEAAYLEAFEAAKEMAADLIRSHVDVTGYRFDVADEAGRPVFDLPFSEVLRRPRCAPRRVGMVDESKRRELLASVAQEIATARATVASARATIERSRRRAEGGRSCG